MSQQPENVPESSGDVSWHRGHRRSNAVLFGAPYAQILQTAPASFSAEHQRLLDQLREARYAPRIGLGVNARSFSSQSILQHQPQHLGYFQPIHPQESNEDFAAYGSQVLRHEDASITNANHTSSGPGVPESSSETESSWSRHFSTTATAAPRTYRPSVYHDYLGQSHIVQDYPATSPAPASLHPFPSGPGTLGAISPGTSPTALGLQQQYRLARWGYPHSIAQYSPPQSNESAGFPDPNIAIDSHDADDIFGSWTPPEASWLGSDGPDTPASSVSSTLVESVWDAPPENARASLYFGPGAILCLTSTCRCAAAERDPDAPVRVERYGFQSVERCECACGCDMRLMVLAETLGQLEDGPDLLCGWCVVHCQF